MTDKERFERGKATLELRKLEISKISAHHNYKKSEKFALNFKNWIFQNLPDNLESEILNWTDLYPDERKKLIRRLVFFFSEYRGASDMIKGVNFKKSDGVNQETLAAVGDRNITLYSKLWDSDDFNELVGAIAHEVTHKFQDIYKTSLPPQIIDLGNKYYIDAEEYMDLYESNPVEKEAIITEQIISDGFIEKLKGNRDFG